jgi:hypothetical protein
MAIEGYRRPVANSVVLLFRMLVGNGQVSRRSAGMEQERYDDSDTNSIQRELKEQAAERETAQETYTKRDEDELRVEMHQPMKDSDRPVKDSDRPVKDLVNPSIDAVE